MCSEDQSDKTWTLSFPKAETDTLYALEKFVMAEYALATGTGDIKDRLLEAAYELTRVQLTQLPEPLRGEFQAIWQQLTKNEPKEFRRPGGKGGFIDSHTGSLAATIHSMRKAKAQEIASAILSINSRLQSYCDSGMS